MQSRRIIALFACLIFACTLPAQSTFPYQNPSLPISRRVDDLVSRMTLEEKVSQMQNHAVAIPRLNIPEYDWWNEALHGVARSGNATVFPQAIGMAATWDVSLVRREATVISTEARAKYNDAIAHDNHGIYYGLDFWSPNINIFRDPRWGRGQETYGEDPFLTSRIGVAFVEAMQGSDPRYFKVIATPKHFAVHSGPESLRHQFNVDVSPFDLEDTYLPAFRATITEAHADSIMCAYNAIDGKPACASDLLLIDHLRKGWNFQGYVTSDCAAVRDISEGHKFAPNAEQGSVVAVKAGTDTTCGTEYPVLVQAVKDGSIQQSFIDTAVKRLFTARFRLGMFDPPASVPYASIPFSENNSPEHRQLALEAANKSIVLLKNQDHTLPLSANIKTIAVIGPDASNLPSIEGNYSGTPSDPITPLKGVESIFAGKATILYAQGSSFTSELPIPVPRTVLHPSPTSTEAGLNAEYFASTDLSGSPVLIRIDPQLNFDWQGAAPVSGLTQSHYSARWTGVIIPPTPGDYNLLFGTRDCYPCRGNEVYRVFLDGLSVFSSAQSNDANRHNTFTIHFASTIPRAIQIEYIHDAPLRGGGITLSWQPPADALRSEAVAIAAKSDVILAFVGLSPDLEGEEMPVHVAGFSGGDRTDIGLPATQQQLLEALSATRKPLVVVLLNGSALAINWAQQHAAAILEAWYPGEEGGTAIAQTLAGFNNPAGRLPVTFYRSLADLPPFEEYSMKNRTYRYFAGKPLYGFGFGLSYTTFSYSNLRVNPKSAQASGPIEVEATITNTGNLPGDEVAELYLTPPASPNSPIRELRGFDRITLAPGTSKQVHFALDARALSTVRPDGTRSVLPGLYRLHLGSTQPNETPGGLDATFTLTGTIDLPR